MSSLDELILFNSAFWREEGMLDGTKYAYMKKLAEHCRRAAGGNFSAGYYEPESMPYMLALRDACHPSGPLAGAGTRGRAYCRKASASAGGTWRAIINWGSRCSCPIRIWYGVPPPILNSGLECVS